MVKAKDIPAQVTAEVEAKLKKAGFRYGTRQMAIAYIKEAAAAIEELGGKIVWEVEK